MAYQNGIVVKRGAAYDEMTVPGPVVIDFSHMKANERQVFIDNTVKYLKGQGFFERV